MTNISSTYLQTHPVVSHAEWLAARKALLAKEKEFTQLRDQLNQQRRELAWEKVEKAYVFDAPEGKVTLGGLFGKNSQLIVYHFMFAPEWDEGCPHCSFWADHYDGATLHLGQRDVSLVVISRASLVKLETFKRRMGWKFKWVSAGQTDFNYDFQASFLPAEMQDGKALYNYRMVDPGDTDREGLSVFYKDERGSIFHTYSCYERGIDLLNTTYNFLDLAPKGRDEDPNDVQGWVRHHDRY